VGLRLHLRPAIRRPSSATCGRPSKDA
jgi:hypothetical protein